MFLPQDIINGSTKTKSNAASIRELHGQLMRRVVDTKCLMCVFACFCLCSSVSIVCFAQILMLFVCGLTSKRDQDAFWKKRVVEDGRSRASKHFLCINSFQKIVNVHFRVDWTEWRLKRVTLVLWIHRQLARMEAGIFVAWNWQMIIVLVVTLLQNWLAGQSQKRHFACVWIYIDAILILRGSWSHAWDHESVVKPFAPNNMQDLLPNGFLLSSDPAPSSCRSWLLLGTGETSQTITQTKKGFQVAKCCQCEAGILPV